MNSQKRGFTLIELMVVILIIMTLASLVIVSVSRVRVSSRDAKRIADLGTISSALQQYYVDNRSSPRRMDSGNGNYVGNYNNLISNGITRDDGTPVIFVGSQGYLVSALNDPKVNQIPGNGCSLNTPAGQNIYSYRYTTNANTNAGSSSYYLWAIMEISSADTVSWSGCPSVYILKNGEIYKPSSFNPAVF